MGWGGGNGTFGTGLGSNCLCLYTLLVVLLRDPCRVCWVLGSPRTELLAGPYSLMVARLLPGRSGSRPHPGVLGGHPVRPGFLLGMCALLDSCALCLYKARKLTGP